ncbi:MAG: methylated-DNA--[protein]-cysteine S-methyltransferase [Saprospiraceae bacterium]|nr:methylated-DNA--[protein]-cysteine S-methyltransferase [Saprospiraceae bacterium]
MSSQEQLNYDRIASAITYIRENFKDQPNLDEVAQSVHLSAYHFQRMFSDWAGVSPKQFLQYVSLQHAKQMLGQGSASLFDAAYETGLSGTGRLHDLFVNIEGMTPGEYKQGGRNLQINYSFAESHFGSVLVASTSKGICHMAFFEEEEKALAALQLRFPAAQYRQITDLIQQNALRIFTEDWKALDQVKLHLKGTDFQLKVWETLLKIPQGALSSYGEVAGAIGKPKASRAVGTAIGNNPVAYLIPCHRVIRRSGTIGQYMWGESRKTAIIGWEAAQEA